MGTSQAPQPVPPLPRPLVEGEGQEAHSITHRFLSVSRAEWASEGGEDGARCPRRPAPHRPQRLIAPAGCPPAAAASGACQLAAAARLPGRVGSQLSGSCGAAHLEREGWGQGRGPGEGSLSADLRRRATPPPKTPGKPRPGAQARDEARESEGIPAGRGRKASSLARPGGSEGPRLAVASPGLSRGWERAGSPPRTPSPRETSRPRGARRGRAEGLVSGRAQSFAH